MDGTVTADGQVALPTEVLEALGLFPGRRVEFEVSGGGVMLRPRRAGSAEEVRERIAKLRGTADAGLTADEILRMTRGEDGRRSLIRASSST